jgi:hypothetical protein
VEEESEGKEMARKGWEGAGPVGRSGIQRNEMMNGKTYVDWMLNASWIQIACRVDLSLLSIKSMINIFLLRIYCFSSKH